MNETTPDAIAQDDLAPKRPPDEVERALEATLFAAEEPMSVESLDSDLGGLENSEVREGL